MLSVIDVGCHLFEQLIPEQAEQLERRASLRGFQKGELIYVPGDSSQAVLVVAKGRVKIKGIMPEGKEFILAFVEEGELFGESALFDDGPREEFAEAAVATEILALRRDDLPAVLRSSLIWWATRHQTRFTRDPVFRVYHGRAGQRSLRLAAGC